MDGIIIRGGMIADGTGRTMYRADVAVKNGVIEEIGDLSGRSAGKVLSAEGLIVAPGFITRIRIRILRFSRTAAVRPGCIRA